MEWAGEAAGVGTWGRTFQVWGCWFSGGHLRRCSWSVDQSGAQGENQRRRLLSCPAERPAHDWVKTVGAGACSQRASGNWRGGVSSILGASLISELRLAQPASTHNQPLHALPPAPDRSSVDVWRAESGQPPCRTRPPHPRHRLGRAQSMCQENKVPPDAYPLVSGIHFVGVLSQAHQQVVDLMRHYVLHHESRLSDIEA